MYRVEREIESDKRTVHLSKMDDKKPKLKEEGLFNSLNLFTYKHSVACR